MRKENQANYFIKLLAAGAAFLVCGLTAYTVHAIPERDALEDYWFNLYIEESDNHFFVPSEAFNWEVPVDQYCNRIAKVIETAEEAKECQVCTDLAHGGIGAWTVSSQPNGAGIIYYNSYEYDVTSWSGRICIDRDDYTTDDRILHEEIMLVGPTYYISYWYGTEPVASPLLDDPAADTPDLLDKAKVDQCFNFQQIPGPDEPNNISKMLPKGVQECPALTDNGDDDDLDTFANGDFAYPNPLYIANDLDGGEIANDPTYPKRNQAYVWSMFMDNPTGNLWYGTGPNIACLVVSSIFGTNPGSLGGGIYCEFGSSPYGIENGLEAAAGDWRPPEIYMYDTGTQVAEEKTPVESADPVMQQAFDYLNDTMGIRATGAVGGVAILGGPSLDAIGGGSLSAGLNGEVYLYAYNSDTGDLIESRQFPEYNDIRKWVLVNGVLYTSMKSTVDGSGHVLRWCGTQGNPFAACGGAGNPPGFQVVGIIPNGMGAYLAEHEGRIFLTTWPAFELGGGELPGAEDLAALFMSPIVPAGGLTAAHVNQWTSVWNVGMYERDYITSFTYGGGAMASHNGYLYWGTIHVQNIANLAATAAHGTGGINMDIDGLNGIDGDEDNVIQLGTHRPQSLFRGRNFGGANQEVELLYGLGYMPKHCTSLLNCSGLLGTPNPPGYTIAEDADHRNNMGQDPLWGPAGFWNSGNVYTWSMEVYKDRLYIGTYDSGSQVEFGVGGGDLYRVDCDHSEAKIENLGGQGNDTNYGIRNMATDGEFLYLGQANPYNLHPGGGYELLRVGDTGAGGICGNDCSPMPGITLSFDQVATGGSCNATVAAGSDPPANYNFLGDTYEIQAGGDFAGPLEVCFAYDEADLTVAESRVAVLHRQDAGSAWEDITSTRDAQANIVCGRADSLSQFSAAEDTRPRGGGGGGGGCFISSASNSFFGL